MSPNQIQQLHAAPQIGSRGPIPAADHTRNTGRGQCIQPIARWFSEDALPKDNRETQMHQVTLITNSSTALQNAKQRDMKSPRDDPDNQGTADDHCKFHHALKKPIIVRFMGHVTNLLRQSPDQSTCPKAAFDDVRISRWHRKRFSQIIAAFLCCNSIRPPIQSQVDRQ
jgi:hypothetical protein